MEQVSLKIGERLKEIRNTRQLTLDDVAELTGVSKPMLGQIERGQSSPTINILWKISTGLKIPLSFFCKQEEAEYMVAGLDGENVITEENGGMRAYPLFPFDPVRNVEVFYIEFDAGVRHESLPHVSGVEEYVFLVQGTLKMVIGGKEVLLQEKQSIRFRADVSHGYHNASEKVGCQLIFSDIGIPKTAWTPDWAERIRNGGQFDIYNYLKTELVKQGIPAEEIAFIHDAKTDRKSVV